MLANGRVAYQGLEDAVKTTCREIDEEFTDNIFEKYGKFPRCCLVVACMLRLLQKPQFRMPSKMQ